MDASAVRGRAEAGLHSSNSLSSEREFARRVSLFEGLRLAVFHDELVDEVGELRDGELQALVGNELLLGLAGEEEEQASVLLEDDLELRAGGGS